MPLRTGPSAVGIVPVGDGSLADLEKLIPYPDAIPGVDDARSTGYHLDEMSPAAANQLRIELNEFLSVNGEEGTNFATGSHAATAGEASANSIVIDTGLETEEALTELIVQYNRAGAGVAGGTVTDNEDGTFTISESGGLNITAADTVDWYARI